jgi:hypothetical protein
VNLIMQFSPPCEKCAYFVPGKYSHTGSCQRYVAYRGRGKLVYEFTDTVRMTENKCGLQGRLFKSENNEKFIRWRDLLNEEE